MSFKRLIAWTLAILLALAFLCANAEDIDAVWKHASGGTSMQEWLDGELAEGAGTATDNYVLCLLRAGIDADYAKYVDAATAKLEAGISNASTRERTALALIACGAPERLPKNLVDDSAGQLGIMSWIYALHLINNGAPSELWTADSIVEQLLDMQLDDGGWKVTGEYGNADVTAMCLQALTCSDVESTALDSSIQRALDFLSSCQLDSGGYANMGDENAESAAQVLIALAGLGVALDDARFVKDGHTPLTALMEYQLPEGGFRHFLDGEENGTATAQALQALIALGVSGTAFYDFSSADAVDEFPTPRFPAWKRWAWIAIGALTLAGAVFALTRKHGRIKQLVFVFIIAAAASAAVWFVQLESAGNYYNPDALNGLEADGHVTLSIRCDTVAGLADDGSTPEDGVILPPSEIAFAEGESVFDALTSAARQYAIQVEHTGTDDLVYINGINYLYEFAYGELSGWLYFVNGERHSVGCGSYPLTDGDEIIWQYTTKLGEDLK